MLSQWLNNNCIIFFYFIMAAIVSILNAVRLKEQSKEGSDDGKLWEAVNNFIFQFFGFVFLYISLERLVKLDDNEDTGNLIVHAILFLVLFFTLLFV